MRSGFSLKARASLILLGQCHRLYQFYRGWKHSDSCPEDVIGKVCVKCVEMCCSTVHNLKRVEVLHAKCHVLFLAKEMKTVLDISNFHMFMQCYWYFTICSIYSRALYNFVLNQFQNSIFSNFVTFL